MAPAPSTRAPVSGPGTLPPLHDRAAVSGPIGSGVTTLVVGRATELAREGRAVLVLHRQPSAARRIAARLLDAAPDAGGHLTATSTVGLARDLLARVGDRRRVLGAGETLRLVTELLAHEAAHEPHHWPVSRSLLERPAFAPALARAVDAARSMWVGVHEVDAHEQATGGDGRWAEAVAFGERLTRAMAERGVIDRTGLVVDAVALLRAPGALERWRTAVPHLLVDDVHALDPASHRLLLTLAGPAVHPEGATLLLAGHPDAPRWPTPAVAVTAEADLDDPVGTLARRLGVEQHLRLDAPAVAAREQVLVRAHDPSLEADAAVGVLLDAVDAGVAPEELAVVVPDGAVGRTLAAAVVRVAARHRLPVQGTTTTAGSHPLVRALHAVVTAAALGDATHDVLTRTLAPATRAGIVDGPDDARLAPIREHSSHAGRAFAAWSTLLAPVLVGPRAAAPQGDGDDRAVDALVAYLDAIDAGTEPHDALEASVRVGSSGVTVTTATGTVGATWHTVVLCGALEGTLPRTAVHVPHLDPALLSGPELPELLTRHRRGLLEETRRFAHLLARAEQRVVAIAAPRPGVLVSRFVEGWPTVGPTLHRSATGPGPTLLAETTGITPVWPDGVLRLSATQLTTFENCPLDYAYQYAVGVRSESGVTADVGSLVHDVLEALLDPSGATPTLERMLALIEERWDPGKFPYRPQEAQYRREVERYLRAWWAQEGGRLGEIVAVEHPFDLPIGPHSITGWIDRVNLLPSGGFEVVDYKTGKVRSQAEVDDDLQLRVYHLASRRDPVLQARGTPTRLRLLFLNPDNEKPPKSVELTVTDDLEQQTEERILGLADEILTETFEPSVEASCDYCSFARLCPLQLEGRETR